MAGRLLAKRWMYPMSLLGIIALSLVGGLYTIDHFLNASGPGEVGPLAHYWNFDDDAVASSIGVLSSIIAAVLGILVTVASIVVQLAANRYTPAVTEMFFRDRKNLSVLALYVVGCILGFWIAFGVNGDWVPKISLLALLIISTVCFLSMAPYFAYVFDFLAPKNVVARLRGEALKAASAEDQVHALTASDQLADIAVNSISQKDKMIAVACVDALRDLTVGYLEDKARRSLSWFRLSTEVKTNPDFSSLAEDSLADLETKRAWFEFKQFRQYQAIYTEALEGMRDINYAIAINTRIIAERARAAGDGEILDLAIKFMNTYLRSTLNYGEVRTAYTILNQYRKIAEDALNAGDRARTLALAKHLRYYGRLFYDRKLAFVTETVAHDLCALCELAHERENPVSKELLKIFLAADPSESEGDVQEASLRGVRKAQLKIATYYLTQNAPDMARMVWDDMKNETTDRLRSIRDELLNVKSKDFWEISDRGGNFDYLEPPRREKLIEFFGWFPGKELHAVSLDSRE
jgi:hypothetical protein